MRRFLIVLIVFLFPSCIVFAQSLEALFYVVDSEESVQSFKENLAAIKIVAPQTYDVDDRGILRGSVDSRIRDLAKAHGIMVLPLVINPKFDQALIHKLLLDPTAQSLAVNYMIEECKRFGYAGFQFDFENIHVTDKDVLNRFYRYAADAFHHNGLILSIAVVPRTSDFAGATEYSKWIYENWRGVYDYKTLAQAGDFISLMTYDQHTGHTPPGPVAGLPWMEKALRFTLQTVPPEKISLGVPLYSEYWYPHVQGEEVHSSGRDISYTQAAGMAERFKAPLKWDDVENGWWTVFERDDVNEYLFVEDTRAFQAMIGLAKKYKVRGFSAWRIGQEDPRIWKVLTQ